MDEKTRSERMRDAGITKRGEPTLLQWQLGKVDHDAEMEQQMNASSNDLGYLLDAYWNAAYAEGVEDRTHDTLEGSAQTARNSIVDAFNKLRSELAEAKKDAERLDWLQNTPRLIVFSSTLAGRKLHISCNGRRVIEHLSIRAAIDAAIQKGQP